ncbi:hypothetical protein [Streptomyces sp. NBC_00872]|uniref:hypothetical protein n=1 Tax=Streptomyces sp. NBC_00872 TaxID=2903686 RepID=UPI00386F9015|nr:hypothetical protein OG214_37775 [Streptomyces sp. NBC_00872]
MSAFLDRAHVLGHDRHAVEGEDAPQSGLGVVTEDGTLRSQVDRDLVAAEDAGHLVQRPHGPADAQHRRHCRDLAPAFLAAVSFHYEIQKM